MQINIAYVVAGLLVFVSSNLGEADARMMTTSYKGAEAHREHKRQAAGYVPHTATAYGGPNNSATAQPVMGSGSVHNVAAMPTPPINTPVEGSSHPESGSIVSPISKAPVSATNPLPPYSSRPNASAGSAPEASSPQMLSPTSQRPVGGPSPADSGSIVSPISKVPVSATIPLPPYSSRPNDSAGSAPEASSSQTHSPTSQRPVGGSSPADSGSIVSPISKVPVSATIPPPPYSSLPNGSVESGPTASSPQILSPTSQHPVGVDSPSSSGSEGPVPAPINGEETSTSSGPPHHGKAPTTPITRASPVQSSGGSPFPLSASTPIPNGDVDTSPIPIPSGGPRGTPTPFGSNAPLPTAARPLIAPGVGFGGPGPVLGGPAFGGPVPVLGGPAFGGPVPVLGGPSFGGPIPVAHQKDYSVAHISVLEHKLVKESVLVQQVLELVQALVLELTLVSVKA
ncbi:uncharacterized protein MELLADRAFT_94526 [Melampsora larici-populina 98AG31]|uniref:Secreted protein n=1 Tax=Melampsora larici-populina (strain 98AG31 / pathotype 3-4-7) TaxID=747676 RepID=F4RBR0_MELLP|nr:uncharacterized protein MELLADRAFT_94526 [Melampsora larici-populina 98AG31]EGG10294.1 hypothetical protein MELLADRAFT_94526 [Melampsora larici-populina 98AG31]